MGIALGGRMRSAIPLEERKEEEVIVAWRAVAVTEQA